MVSCRHSAAKDSGSQEAVRQTFVPTFNADSSFAYIERQVAFGPRVPNTAAHREASAYLAAELRRHGAQVALQEFQATAYDGTLLEACNIIASFFPEKSHRILLFAHWDSRPYADNDPQPQNHRTPIDGANDGASGVAVLLEIARQIEAYTPKVGVDIFFFDVEDYGKPYFSTFPDKGDTWALGAQYWANTPHDLAYRADYGILLDMVGGKGSRFAKEGFSLRQAPDIVNKVWNAARVLGYGDYFVDMRGGFIDDDHIYVGRRVPSIDIIAYDEENGFVPQWHTLDDTVEYIDKAVLEAVGQTLLWVIYNE